MIGIDTSFLVAWEMDAHPFHQICRNCMTQLSGAGHVFALTSSVIAEFIHVVTDGRRFEKPLSMDSALARATFWRDANETLHVEPDLTSLVTFELWMRTYNLGRKRILDTLLAATYHRHGATDVLTINQSDFSLFGCFNFPIPSSSPPSVFPS